MLSAHTWAVTGLCCLPLLLLPALWLLDAAREPDNAITHESGDPRDEDPDGMLAAA